MLNNLQDIETRIVKNNAAWLLLIFLLIFVLRLPSSTRVVINWDESAYFIVAQDVVDGGVPYKTSWVHRAPIQFFLLAPIIKLFGNNIFVLRIFTTIYLLVSMFFIYLIAKRLFQEGISLIPPLIYGLFFTTLGSDGLASNSELFMMLPAIVAALCFIIYIQNKKYSYLTLFLCGLFSATAFLIKASAFFTIVIFPIVLILKKIKLKQYSWNLLFKEMLWYLLGGGIIGIIILGYFAFHNAVIDFCYGAYLFNYYYVNTVSILGGFKSLLRFLGRTVTCRFDFITVLALGSALFLFLKRDMPKNKKKIAYFIIGLTFFSTIGVYLGRKMHPHYFLQMALPFSLLIAFAISIIEINAAYLNKIIYVGIIIILLASAIHVHRHIGRFFVDYNNRKNEVHYKIAGHIKTNTKEEDTIFVLGGQPIIYFLSERKAPTKYFCWLYYYGKWEKILQIENSTVSLFSENKPEYFVYRENGSQEVKGLKKFMMDNYHIETKFDDYILYKVNKKDGS